MLYGLALRGLLLRTSLFIYLALVLFPKHEFLLTSYARCSMELGNAPSAIAALRGELELESLTKQSIRQYVLMALADALACDYQLTESKSLVRDCLAKNPHDARALHLDLQIALLQKDFTRARIDAEKLEPNRYEYEDAVQTARVMDYVTRDHNSSVLDYKWKQWRTPKITPHRDKTNQYWGSLVCHAHPWSLREGSEQYVNAKGYFFALNSDDKKAQEKFKYSLHLLEHPRFKTDYFRFIDAATQYASLILTQQPLEASYWTQAARLAATTNHLPYTEPAEIEAQRRRDIYDRNRTTFYADGPMVHGIRTLELVHIPSTIYN